MAHSKYSASGFEAVMLCPGKRVMEMGLPDSSSKYADEGTAAHSLLDQCLSGNLGEPKGAIGDAVAINGKLWAITVDMAEAVQTALDNIKTIAGPDAMILSEQRVCYAEVLGVPKDEGWGTADVIAARSVELQVHDYKHGMGVEVDAGYDVLDENTGALLERRPNPQMALYALGALAACQGTLGDFETVRLVIHQPRIKDAPSEYVLPVEALAAWAAIIARSSVIVQQNAESEAMRFQKNEAWQAEFLNPGRKQCKFCKAKATCPALIGKVEQAVGAEMNVIAEFQSLPHPDMAEPDNVEGGLLYDNSTLSHCMQSVDLIDDWCKAVRAEVERRLLAGDQVPGFKVVAGKRGNRTWADPAEAETLLKSFRVKLEQMYDMKLISPTAAAKLVKAGAIGPRQWKAAEELIVQTDGKPHVAKESDPRPALTLTAAVDDFDSVSVEFA